MAVIETLSQLQRFVEDRVGELHRLIGQVQDAVSGQYRRGGSATVSLAAAVQGTVQVAHGLPVAPTGVVATAEDVRYVAAASAFTDGEFTLSVREVDGTSRTVDVACSWEAVGGG